MEEVEEVGLEWSVEGRETLQVEGGEEKEVSEISTDRVYADSYSYLIYSGLVVTSF